MIVEGVRESQSPFWQVLLHRSAAYTYVVIAMFLRGTCCVVVDGAKIQMHMPKAALSKKETMTQAKRD